MRRRRAFTLLELSVTLAIAGVIATAAVSATVLIQRSFSAARGRLDQTNDARVVLEHVLDRVRTAGGGRVRPWQAVAVTCVDDGVFDLPDCDGPAHQRRLHLLELEQQGQGVVTAASGATITIAAPGGVCPISAANGYVGPTPVVLVAPESRLEANGGASWLTALCAPVACGCTLQQPGMGGFNPVPTPGTVTTAAFVGGTISRGHAASYFIDPGTRDLVLLKDFEATGFASRTALAPDVAAFDVALGYDDNADGEVDAFVASPAAGRMRNLRLVRVGLALAKRSKDGIPVPTTIFGDVVGGLGSRAMSLEGTALVRATGVFQ